MLTSQFSNTFVHHHHSLDSTDIFSLIKLVLTKAPTNKQCFDAMISRNAKQATLAAISGLVSFGMLPYIFSMVQITERIFLNKDVYLRNVVEGPKLEDDGFHSDHRPLTCQRHCSRRINTIYYKDNSAGLGDRKSIIHDLSQLAGYLCAEVVVPPPSKFLHERHNFGRHISTDLLWSDLYNITFIEDGNPVIRSTEAEFDADYDSFKSKDWFHIVSSSGLKLEEDFKRVEMFSLQQDLDEESSRGFVWEINEHWLISDLVRDGLPVNQLNPQNNDKMRPGIGLKEGCVYSNSDTEPSHLQIMQKRLLNRFKRLSPQNSIFGLLHLRRGDSIDTCNTSVDRVKEYLACSLDGTESLGRNITLLMMTDEDDVEYRQDIMGLLDDFTHVSILDADDIVAKIVRESVRNGIIDAGLQNNFYVYDIEKVFQGWDSAFTNFHLVRRRTMCTDCIPVKSILALTVDV